MNAKFLAAPAVLAAASLLATPAAAIERPGHAPTAVEAAAHYGPGWGWGGGYRHHRHRNRTSAGDVLAGVLIIGTIAAIANAASRANERRGYPYPERYPYPDRRGDYRDRAPQGIDGAADLCLREIERDARVREVTRVERTAAGWTVSGDMADGAGFTCSIGPDGRIDDVTIGGRVQGYAGPDNQYGDDRYLAARAAADAGTLPAYPGGPLPGEASDD